MADVTRDPEDVEALAEVLLAVDVTPAERAGMPFPASAYLIEGNGSDFSRAILSSDWLASHVAAAREADRAEIEHLASTLAGLRRVHGETVQRLAGLVAKIEALESRWSTALDDGCPSCGPVGFTGCDHIEGYHHALSDLRALLAAAESTALDEVRAQAKAEVAADLSDLIARHEAHDGRVPCCQLRAVLGMPARDRGER